MFLSMTSDSRKRRGGLQTRTCLEPHRLTDMDELTVFRKCDHRSVRRKDGDHGVVVGVRRRRVGKQNVHQHGPRSSRRSSFDRFLVFVLRL
jgi:hypothetical protein